MWASVVFIKTKHVATIKLNESTNFYINNFSCIEQIRNEEKIIFHNFITILFTQKNLFGSEFLENFTRIQIKLPINCT